jgi:hypothetical protein
LDDLGLTSLVAVRGLSLIGAQIAYLEASAPALTGQAGGNFFTLGGGSCGFSLAELATD